MYSFASSQVYYKWCCLPQNFKRKRRHKKREFNWLMCLNYIQTFGINAACSSVAAVKRCRQHWRFKPPATNRPEIDARLLPCYSIKAGSKGITIKPNERITNRRETWILSLSSRRHARTDPSPCGTMGRSDVNSWSKSSGITCYINKPEELRWRQPVSVLQSPRTPSHRDEWIEQDSKDREAFECGLLLQIRLVWSRYVISVNRNAPVLISVCEKSWVLAFYLQQHRKWREKPSCSKQNSGGPQA